MSLKKCANNHFYESKQNEYCPYCPSVGINIPPQQPISDDSKTVALWDSPSGTEPVVGWLVCVKGSYFGESFNLKAGNNSVGRSMDMDIPLAQENSISRSRHCVITFEPEKQEYFIRSVEGVGATYLNDEAVTAFTQVKEYDVIKIGNCEFIFYPLCGNNFSWENVI